MPDSWKLTLPCTKEEAEAIAADISPLADLDPPPVLMTSEPDPASPQAWRLDAYFETKPDARLIRMIRALVPSAADMQPAIERIADADWVTLSQAGLEPIRAGRFFVHTAAHAGDAPPGAIAFSIEAGQAFGTGHHETTTGCLLMLDRLKSRGARFDAIADIGTGTGLLAFAALALWPEARAIATDIDPVAIDVARDNAAINRVPLGHGPGELLLAVADGMDSPLLAARAPFDLIVANILAGPLIDLAPDFAAALAPGGTIILAGLLDTQAEAVMAAYERLGLSLAHRGAGEWPALILAGPGSTPPAGSA